MVLIRAALATLVLLVALGGCSPDEEELALPAARRSGTFSLEAALAARRSARRFTGAAPAKADIGQLLWAAQGLSAERGTRTAPSAGALYPLELYVASRAGVFRYVPQGHRLDRIGEHDVRGASIVQRSRRTRCRLRPS